MNTAAKIIYVAQAIGFTAGGIFYLYAAGRVGDGALYWFGVDAYVCVGVAFLYRLTRSCEFRDRATERAVGTLLHFSRFPSTIVSRSE